MNNRTSSERIMDALDLLDEDMALEVAKLREKKKKRPVLWRYGMIAAGFCVTMLCVLQLAPLTGRVPEDGVTGDGVSLENMGAHPSGTENLEGIGTTVSENEEWSAEEWSEGETAGDVSESDEKDEDLEMEPENPPVEDPVAPPETDEKPSVKVRIEGFDGELAYCTVFENEGTIFPAGTNLYISFEKWKDAGYQTIKPEELTVGMEIWVMFSGYDGDIIFAVMLYEQEE